MALEPTVGLLDVVMLGAGSALGFSIFSVLGPAARIAGTGLLVAVLVAALPMAVFGILYAFLASVNPRSGASFEWPREYIHPFAGFLIAWLRIFGNTGQLTVIATVLLHYLGMLLPVPQTLGMLVLFGLVFVVNLRGIAVAARLQTILMAALIFGFVVFVATGLPEIRVANLLPLMPNGVKPIALAIPILVSLFMGIESATEVGEEVVAARRNVPRGIGMALALIAVVYLAVSVTTLGLIGARSTASSSAPIAAAAAVSLGKAALPLVVIGATIALLKSLNASFLIFSRSFYAMARAGCMPVAMGVISPVRHVPVGAVVAAFICACFGILLPNGLVFLFLATNIPLILKYGSTCLCATIVARRRSTLAASSSLALNRGLIVLLGGLGLLLAFGLFVLGIDSDPRPYALLGGWGVIGIIFWFAWARKRSLPVGTERTHD